jgi:hypothetical protein
MTRLSEHGLLERLRLDGIQKTLFTGWSALVVRQMFSWVSFLVALEEGTRWVQWSSRTLFPYNSATRSDAAAAPGGDVRWSMRTTTEKVLTSVIAGSINTLVVCPFDAVACHYQKDAGLPRSSVSYYSRAFPYLYRMYGPSVFYAGWKIKLMRSIAYATIFQMLVELMNHDTYA